MIITLGTTAYVSGIGDEMLDAIERSGVIISATGDGLVYTDPESIREYLNDNPGGISEYLNEVLSKVESAARGSSVGNIVFVS